MGEDDDGFCQACGVLVGEKEWSDAYAYQYGWRYFFRHYVTRKTQALAFLPKEFPIHNCLDCANKLTPWAAKFADIYALISYNNHLMKVIKERENERT